MEADLEKAESDLATAESDNVRLYEQNLKLKEELSTLITRCVGSELIFARLKFCTDVSLILFLKLVAGF